MFFSGLDARMPEKKLNRSDVLAFFEQGYAECVAKLVRMPLESCLRHDTVDRLASITLGRGEASRPLQKK